MTTCCASSPSVLHRGLVSLVVVSALSAAAFVGGDGAPAPKAPALDPYVLFPSTTVLTVSLDGGPCVASAKDLAITKIWNEPEVQAFLKDGIDLLKEQIENGKKGAAKELGLEPGDLEALLKTRITLGLTRFEMAEGGGEPKIDIMLAADLRGQQKVAQSLLKIAEQAIGAGNEAAVKDTTIGGVPARTMALPGGGPFDSVSYLFHEGWLLAGSSTAQLEAAIGRAKSGDAKDSLQSNAFFAACMKEVGRPKTVFSFYMDYSTYMDIFGSAMPPTMKPMITASGLGAMKALAMGSDLDGNMVRDRIFLAMSPNSPIERLMAPTDPAGILSRIPKRALAAWTSNINVRGYYDYVKKLVEAIPEAGSEFDAGVAEVDKLLGPTWREDLLPNIGPEIGVFVATPQFGVVPDVGVLVKVGDKSKVENAIAKMLDRPEMKGAARSVTFNDATIQYLDLGTLDIDKDVNMRPAWTFVDGWLLVTATPHNAKNLITAMAQKDGGLMARDDFAKTFARLKGENPNAGNMGIGYLDAQWLAGFLLDSLIPVAQSAVPARKLKKLGGVNIDLGKIPSTQSITKHLSAILMQSQTKEGGVYSEFVTPTGVVGSLAVLGGVGALFAVRMADEVMGGMSGETEEPSERDARGRVRKKKEEPKDKDKDEDKDK